MQTFRTKKTAGFTLVEIMIVVLIIGILLAIAIPNFIKARESSRAQACIANLKQIDSGVQQNMMDNRLAAFAILAQTGNGTLELGDPTAAAPPITSLVPNYVRSTPTCPELGKYNSGDGTSANRPKCSVGATATPAHQLP